MNDLIRSLQQKAHEKYQEADALLSKAEPTDAEAQKGRELVEEVKGLKTRIDNEFKNLAARGDLTALKGDLGSDPESPFQWSGKAAGGDGYWLGSKDAGKTVVDSFGTVLEDVGEGTFGSRKAFEHIGTREYKRAVHKFIRAKGSLRGFHGSELKTIQEGFDSQGGAWLPADVLTRIVSRTPTPTRLSGMVTSITTGSDRVVIPRTQYGADDIYPTAFRASWTGEIPANDDVADVTDADLTGNLEIPIFTAMMTASATNDMLEDVGFNFMGWLEMQLRTTLDLLKDNMILNGTGRGQPQGLLYNLGGVGTVTAIPTATAATLAADDLTNLCMSIPEQYEDGCGWVFNKTNTANAIMKIKDANNRYMFGYGVQDSGLSGGRPKELRGYPFCYSGFMPNLGSGTPGNNGTVAGTTGQVPILFGDIRGYWQVNRLGATVQILRETRAKRNQIEIVIRVRFGGKPVEPWRMRALSVA